MKSKRLQRRSRRGETNAAGLIIMTVVLALGAIVGLTTLRDQLTQELGDLAVGLESLNQSYTTATSTFTDPGTTLVDPVGSAPAGIDLTIPPATE